MRREDVVDLIGRIPEADHAKLQIVLRSGQGVSVDTFVRFEPHYMALRGREAGNPEENRAFFIPYDEVVCVKLERVVKLSEIAAMYGDELPAASLAEAAETPGPVVTPSPTVTPAPAAPLDPAEIAKQNLLERIRAARSMTMAGNGARPAAGK
jgi:hypothetical protein